MSTTTVDTDAKQEAIRALTENRNNRFERAKQETIAEIMVSPDLDESEKQALKNKLLPEESPITAPALIGIRKEMPATVAQAVEIFGSDFITPAKVLELFPMSAVYAKHTKPEHKLPFSVLFLEEARSAGCMMVYQPTHEGGGTIGLPGFAEFCKGKKSKGGGKLLYGDQFDLERGIVSKKAWFAEKQYSEYRDQQIIQSNVFRIAKKSEIAGTPSERFMAQVMLQCEWIEKSFPKSITEAMKTAVAEVRRDVDMLTKTQNNDSVEFLKQIVKYKFFTLFMETGLETLLRMVVTNQATGEKLLTNMYLRNGVTEPVASALGNSGDWAGPGPSLSRHAAGDSDSYLGLGFSCIDC